METKPFSLQSPEKVAETYGGNKQKIAQAIQMGVIDPTSGLLAGMFIDRMRSAQMMEQAPQQSVAQKVFNPQPQQPPQGGLGAMPPGAGAPPPPPPQMPQGAPPPPMPQGAPPVGMAAGGMAELPEPNNPYNPNAGGGLTTLPIPDDMYDEHSFAGGGIVAFADGGSASQKLLAQADQLEREASDPRKYSRAQAMSMRAQAAELRNAAAQSGVGESALGALKAFGTGVGRFFTAPQGEPLVPSGEPTPKSLTPSGYQSNLGQIDLTPFNAGPAAGLGAIAPASAPVASAPVVPRSPAAAAAPNIPVPNTPAAETIPAYMKDLMKPITVGTPEEEAAKIEKYLGEPPKMALRTEEEKAAQKNEDLWSALAQIGFGMAAGDSPNALVNISKAASAAIPGMQEAIKERRKENKEDLKQQLAYEMSKYGMKKDAYLEALKHVDGMTKDERARALAVAQIGSAEATAAENRKSTEATAAANRSTQLQVAGMYTGQKGAEAERYATMLVESGRARNMAEARLMVYDATTVKPASVLTPDEAEYKATQIYKTRFPYAEPPEGADAWIAAKTRELLGSSGRGSGGEGGGYNPALWGQPVKK
jgi:hypothetical protein